MSKSNLPNPHHSLDDFVNYMVLCLDLQNEGNVPASQEACVTYMSHMHNLRYDKGFWDTVIYPLYLERFSLVH